MLGAPRMELIGTPHVERYNLTQRHIVGRTRRLCLAFSKTKRGHEAAMALGIFAYNFVREHSALGLHVTPAMAAGLTDHPWTIAELVEAALAEPAGEKPVAVPLTMPAERAGRVSAPPASCPTGAASSAWSAVPRRRQRAARPSTPPPAGPAAFPLAPAVALVAVEASADPVRPARLAGLAPASPGSPAPPSPPREPSKLLPPGQLGLFGIDLEPEPKT